VADFPIQPSLKQDAPLLRVAPTSPTSVAQRHHPLLKFHPGTHIDAGSLLEVRANGWVG